MASIRETVHSVANRKPKLEKGKVHRITVEKADDNSGYSVEAHHEDRGEYRPPHTSIHKNLASVHKHMKECFEGPKDDDGDETDEM
jgi:hypothetical protein